MEAEFTFVLEDEFGAAVLEAFMNAAGDRNSSLLTFEQFFPLIKEVAGELGEKMSDGDAPDCFNDADTDGNGTCDIDEFVTLSIALLRWQEEWAGIGFRRGPSRSNSSKISNAPIMTCKKFLLVGMS